MHEYLAGFVGGCLIGVAAVLLMATQGSVLGVSGIVSRLLPPVARDWDWRAVFILGLLVAPTSVMLLAPESLDVMLVDNLALLIAGGLLVGIGTVLGNGCTSGHSVCGISRFSKRSFIATVVFMLFAIITVYLVRHILFGDY